jgi:predicted molibdopterin-dependent oxidoreductase YjgC
MSPADQAHRAVPHGAERFELTIDGRTVEASAGETILDAARRLGIEIPLLCHEERVEPMGSCRMCLVEIDRERRMQPACAFKAAAAMQVKTATARVERHRRGLLSLYSADHELDAEGLPKARGTGNRLREHVISYGTGPALSSVAAPRDGREDPNPYVHFDPQACILCNLCVRYCDEVEAVSAITLAGRGPATTIATADQESLLDTTCELCGGCIAVCPTGAMTEKPALGLDVSEETQVRTTCSFCGVGCQLNLHVRDDRVVRVTSPPPGETVNDGNLCIKGRFSYEFIHHEDRYTTPLIRAADGTMRRASWDEAIRATAEGLLGVKERHGADALGFVSSSRCTGEENYMMQKLARAAFGTNNVHQCAAT